MISRRRTFAARAALVLSRCSVRLFLFAFGQLFLTQVAQLLRSAPDLIRQAIEAINHRLSTNYSVNDVISSLHLTPDKVTGYVNGIVGGVLDLLGSLAGALLSASSFTLLTFYLSADGPRHRLWLARRLPGTNDACSSQPR